MITNFNEVLAVEIKDIQAAVFIENIAHWIRVNATKDNPAQRNLREGRFWTYNSLPELCKLFPVWTPRVIRTIISRAIEAGLIIKDSFNKKKFDKTSWFTLTDKALSYFPALQRIIKETLGGLSASDIEDSVSVNSDRSCDEIDTTIPITTTSSSNINITAASSSSNPKKPSKKVSQPLLTPRQMIDVYREIFPDNPQPHKIGISTSLNRTLTVFAKRYPEVEPNGSPLTLEGFKRYLIALKEICPKFSLGSYFTADGRKKKNDLETFCRWNTFIRFLEDAYS